MASELVEEHESHPSKSAPEHRYIRERNEPHSADVTHEAVTSSGAEKRKRSWTQVAIMLLSLIAAFGAGVWVTNQRAYRESQIALPAEEVVPIDGIVVTAAPVVERSLQRSVPAVGTLHGFEELTLSSKLEGRVLRVHYDLASVVKPGDVLLELDPTDAELAVRQAERSVQSELARWGFKSVPSEDTDIEQLPTVVSARLKYELAESRLERMLPLQATNTISEDEIEQAKSDVQVSQSEWNNQKLLAKSAVATARLRQADLEIAMQRLADCKIRVPTPTMVDDPTNQLYTISERSVSEGTLLRPGTEVFKLVLGKTLKLRLAVPESYSTEIAVGQNVELLTSFTKEPAVGKVARISPAFDRQTRSLLVEVEVPNSDGRLKPGSFAKAKILTSLDPTAITIPVSGLYSFAGINKIFTVSNGVAHEVKVTVGEQTNDWVEIASPKLPKDAVVVTSGQRLLSDGLPITIREHAEGAASAETKPPQNGEKK